MMGYEYDFLSTKPVKYLISLFKIDAALAE